MESRPAPLVELSLVFTADVAGDAALLRRYDRQLSPDERAQRDRFHFERDRLRYTVTRFALREVLSSHAPVAPADWQFAANAWGKPHVAGPPCGRAVSFNVSHTDGLVLIGVTRRRALGVDVEQIARPAPLDIASRYFSPREATALRMLPSVLQQRRFHELWTLKESYVKARGMGLSIPLDRFRFELDRDPQGIELVVDASLEDTAARWHFHQFDAGPEHLAAVCVEIVCGDVATLAAWRLVPGVSRDAMPVTATRVSRTGAPAEIERLAC